MGISKHAVQEFSESLAGTTSADPATVRIQGRLWAVGDKNSLIPSGEIRTRKSKQNLKIISLKAKIDFHGFEKGM